MKDSLSLGKIAGIRLYIHWTFLILIGWIFFSYYQKNQSTAEAITGVWFILALFACVTLHELGHALTARRFNITTKKITLYPIGGVAQMEKLPEKPVQELWVALAGPMVNLVIAALLFFYLNATSGFPTLENLAVLDASNFMFGLFTANIVLALFNLIPAFPMDGGRVLRALLSFKFERGKATRIAATIGQMLAIGFVFLGFFSNFWLVFIGVFIYLGAESEASYEETKSALSGFKVKDALMHRFTRLYPTDPLRKAIDLLLDGQEREFVVADGDTVTGILTRDDLVKGLAEHGAGGFVSNAMRTDFISLDPYMALEKVYHEMISTGCVVAPVYDGDALLGILNKENIEELLLVRKVLNYRKEGL